MNKFETEFRSGLNRAIRNAGASVKLSSEDEIMLIESIMGFLALKAEPVEGIFDIDQEDPGYLVVPLNWTKTQNA